MTKYEPLGRYLRSQSGDTIRVSLEEISELVGELPPNAQSRQFWANTKHHYSRRRSWLDEGFKAYFEPPSSVRFERAREPDGDWTLAELRDCVLAYKKLLEAQRSDIHLNKSELRRQVLPYLRHRTDSSYEYRMQNISAVMESLGMDTVKGYPPARNVGGVADAIIELVVENFPLPDAEMQPSDNPIELLYRARAAEAKYENDPNKRAPEGSVVPQRGTATTNYFKRDPEVVGWVKVQAGGKCEACHQDAPFHDKMGRPFLEVHHIRPLGEGGSDTVTNAVALCPNCHRAMHSAHDAGNRRRKLFSTVPRLAD